MDKKEFQKMQEIVEAAEREKLGQKMVSDLLEIAELTGQPIKHMVLNSHGVFVEVEEE